MPVCKKNGIEYTELQIANDGIAVVTNKENDWVDVPHRRAAEEDLGAGLARSTTGTRSTRASRTQTMTLSGPGTDSGTFDFFTEEINGEEGASRADYQATEDDNVPCRASTGDKGGARLLRASPTTSRTRTS